MRQLIVNSTLQKNFLINLYSDEKMNDLKEKIKERFGIDEFLMFY